MNTKLVTERLDPWTFQITNVTQGDSAECESLVKKMWSEHAALLAVAEAAGEMKCPASDNIRHDGLACMRCWCYGMLAGQLATLAALRKEEGNACPHCGKLCTNGLATCQHCGANRLRKEAQP